MSEKIKGLDKLAEFEASLDNDALVESEPLFETEESYDPAAIFNPGLEQDIVQQELYGDKPLQAGALGAASSLSFGLSDQALTKSGIYSPEELKGIEEANAPAYTAGEVGGIVAPLIATGGTSLAARGIAGAGKGVVAASKAGAAVEKAVAKELGKKGYTSLSAKIAEKAASEGAGSAAEGALYSAGRLLKEDAIGDADFNAENLLSSVGSGALYGGAIGGSFGAFKPLVSKAGEKSSEVFSGIRKKIFDDGDAATSLAGMTGKQIERAEKINPQFKQDLANYFRNDLKLELKDTIQKIEQKNNLVKSTAGKSIDDIINKLDQNTLPQSVNKQTIFGEPGIAGKIKSDIIDQFDGVPGYSGYTSEAKKIREEYLALANKEGPISPKDLHKLRQAADQLVYKTGSLENLTLKKEASLIARKILRGTIDDIANGISPELGQQLKTANRQYYMASTVEKPISKKIDKKQILSWSDLILGSAGYGAGEVGGLVGVGAFKLLKSDIAKRAAILAKMERVNGAVNQQLKDSISSFLSKGGKSGKSALIYKLSESPIASKEGSKDKPKNSEEAYNNIKDNVTTFLTDPEKLINKAAKSTYMLRQVAPNTASQVSDRMVKIITFLNEKMPKDARVSFMQDKLGRKYKPSSMELAKFNRYVQIIDSPLSAFKELENKTLTREHVETLKAIYPNLYSRIRFETLEQLADGDKNYSYGQKVQMGILLDIPVDDSLTPEMLTMLQSNFIDQDQEDTSVSGSNTAAQAGTPMGDTSSIKIANRTATSLQKVQYGDS